MSYLSTLIPDCPNLQDSLYNVFVSCAEKGMFNERLPFLTFLSSEPNASLLQQRILPGNGKIRTIELIYDQRLDVNSAKLNVDNPTCEATGKKGQCVTTCTIDEDQNFSFDCVIEARELRRNCEDNPSYVQREILRLLEVADRKASIDIAAKAALLNGKWAKDVLNQDETTAPADNLLVSTKDASGGLSPFTFQAIETAKMQTMYCDQTAIFGGIKLFNYAKSTDFAGCCSQFGSDLKAAWDQFGIATLYDRHLAEALGGNEHNLITQPGALQLLRYTQAGWTNGMPGEYHSHNYHHQTIVSPKTGLPYDLILKEDCGKLNIILIGTFDLKSAPSDLAPVGDNFEGVNYVNRIEVI